MAIKRITDLRINDQMYIILKDGRLITEYVVSIRKSQIELAYIYVNYDDTHLSHSGAVSASTQNYSCSRARCSYEHGDIYCVTSDYRLAIKLCIAQTRKVIEKYNAQLIILTDNALKDV